MQIGKLKASGMKKLYNVLRDDNRTILYFILGRTTSFRKNFLNKESDRFSPYMI
jgi:hypothetical protein